MEEMSERMSNAGPVERTRNTKPLQSTKAPRRFKLFDRGKKYYTEKEKRELLRRLIAKSRRRVHSFQLLEFVRFARSFHQYSPYNLALIYMQFPTASFVAGERQWERKYGRTLKKGEHGIYILVPYFYGRHFAFHQVFDVSQTKGKKLPEYIKKAFEVKGDFEEIWFDRLLEYAEGLGMSVRFEKQAITQQGSVSPGNMTTSYHGGGVETVSVDNFQIVLNEDSDKRRQFAAAVHEVAHVLLGHLGGVEKAKIPDRHGLPTNIEEMEAEGVAHLVCKWLDLETYSSRYLALYAGGVETRKIGETSVIYAAGKIERAIKGYVRKKEEEDSSNTVLSAPTDAETTPSGYLSEKYRDVP